MAANTTTPRPVVLCILDGWGYREEIADNAIKQASTPNYDRFWDNGSRAWLATSGEAVGLPDGQMGNSEVGHTNLGSGRVVMQDLPRIDDAIKTGALAENTALKNFIRDMKASGGTAHLMGLSSPGGVHSHQGQITALAGLLDGAGIPVRIHAFMDGRDTPPKSGKNFIGKISDDIKGLNDTLIATTIGRYWAMDRDKRWDRVSKAYGAMVMGTGEAESTDSAMMAIEAAYKRGESDEFIAPTIVGKYAGMQDGDGILMANFRADRAREILTTLVDPAFDGFERQKVVNFAAKLGMVEYSTALDAFMPALFPADDINDSFGEVISNAGLKQLRIAETEKYAHVTFFFNGGLETEFNGEDRILVPSPNVATYDLQPEMSALEVTSELIEAIKSDQYATIIVNFANPDMVGHTGILSAAIEAVEAVDKAIGAVADAVTAMGGVILITADHGNVELMTDQSTGIAHTAHTSFDVPLLMVGNDTPLNDGCLADIAPTMLSLLGLSKPKLMTGKNLLNPEARIQAAQIASA